MKLVDTKKEIMDTNCYKTHEMVITRLVGVSCGFMAMAWMTFGPDYYWAGASFIALGVMDVSLIVSAVQFIKKKFFSPLPVPPPPVDISKIMVDPKGKKKVKKLTKRKK